MDKENIDRREILEIYKMTVVSYGLDSNPFRLGEAYICSEFLCIPFDLFLSDVGLTEDEFISFL